MHRVRKLLPVGHWGWGNAASRQLAWLPPRGDVGLIWAVALSPPAEN